VRKQTQDAKCYLIANTSPTFDVSKLRNENSSLCIQNYRFATLALNGASCESD
jgi:hypothetical protein